MPRIEFSGRAAAASEHLRLPLRALLPDRRKRSSTASTGEENWFVEGGTLDSLSALSPVLAGRVNCVVANLPRIAERSEQGLDSWMAGILPMLRMVERLMAYDGAVLVLCDERTLFPAKLLLDEVFRQGNHIATFVWDPQCADDNLRSRSVEYALAFRKSARFDANSLTPTDEQAGRYTNRDGDARGPWKAMDYTCRYTREERPKQYYPVVNPTTGAKKWPSESRVWAHSQESHATNVRTGQIWWGADGTNEVPAKKRFIGDGLERKPATVLMSADLLGEPAHAPDAAFVPGAVIDHLLRIFLASDEVVVLPFSDGGATVRAVLRLNDEDGGSRRFVAIGDDGIAAGGQLFAAGAEKLPAKLDVFTLSEPVTLSAVLSGSPLPDFATIARLVFQLVVGRTLDSLPAPGSLGLVGRTEGVQVHLLYRPQAAWLASKDSGLDRETAIAIASSTGGRRCVVVATWSFVPANELTDLGIEILAFPFGALRNVS